MDVNHSEENSLHQTFSNEKVRLPEPDFRNITVLSKKLPTQPILPWLAFNSLWLRRDKYTK